MKFNHEYRSLGMAIGVTKEREEEIRQLVHKSLKETKCASQATEYCMNEGLSLDEVLLVGFELGFQHGANKMMNNRILPGSKEEMMKLLKVLLTKMMEDESDT